MKRGWGHDALRSTCLWKRGRMARKGSGKYRGKMSIKFLRTKRNIQVCVAASALIASGIVVGVSGASAAASHHKVTITFWNAYNDVTETPVMNGIVIPAFESQNPDIIVKDDTLPYAGLLNKFIASSAAGDPPDLMRSDIAWVSQLASEGTLLETSKQPWFAAMKKELDPGPLSTNLYKGGYYGVPDDTNTQVLFYNKADFAAAGLTPPTTWSQMMTDAQTLTIPSKGQHGLGVDSTDIWNVGPYVGLMAETSRIPSGQPRPDT